MARKVLSGVAEVEKALKHLSDKGADAVAKAAIRGQLSVAKKEIRKDAPVGPTGNLKAGVNSRLDNKGKRGTVRAKVGLNVGKQKGTRTIRGPHAHLVALGTKTRYRQTIGGKFAFIKHPTREQLTTGHMTANPFVRDAVGRSQSQMLAMARKRAAKALARAELRAKKQQRSN
jgi:hypothetical protein